MPQPPPTRHRQKPRSADPWQNRTITVAALELARKRYPARATDPHGLWLIHPNHLHRITGDRMSLWDVNGDAPSSRRIMMVVGRQIVRAISLPCCAGVFSTVGNQMASKPLHLDHACGTDRNNRGGEDLTTLARGGGLIRRFGRELVMLRMREPMLRNV